MIQSSGDHVSDWFGLESFFAGLKWLRVGAGLLSRPRTAQVTHKTSQRHTDPAGPAIGPNSPFGAPCLGVAPQRVNPKDLSRVKPAPSHRQPRLHCPRTGVANFQFGIRVWVSGLCEFLPLGVCGWMQPSGRKLDS